MPTPKAPLHQLIETATQAGSAIKGLLWTALTLIVVAGIKRAGRAGIHAAWEDHSE
jgi:hypothetical protein